MRKSFEEKRRRRREKGQQRAWKLKSMKAEAAEEPVVKGRGRHGNAAGINREELDRERFMQVCFQLVCPDVVAGIRCCT